MVKFITLLIILFWNQNPIFGQTTDTKSEVNKHAVIVAVWGNYRSIASVNYERIFSTPKCRNTLITTSVGFGILPGYKTKYISSKSIKAVPILVSLLVGKKKHFAELGLGYTRSFGQNAVDSTVFPPYQLLKYESAYSINVGYRYMEYKGVMFVITPLSLIWTNNKTSKVANSFSFSIGSTF